MNRFRLVRLDENPTSRLHGMLEKLSGPAGETARWIMDDEDRWGSLCKIADDYSNVEPLNETWKDAEDQWRDVYDAAHALNMALKSLGHLACAIRLDAGVRSPGLWERVSGFLHPVLGEAFAQPVHDLEVFAGITVEECERMKVQGNGAKRGGQSRELPFLFHQICDLLEVPTYPWAHVQRIGGVVHAWSLQEEAKKSKGNPKSAQQIKALREEAMGALGNPRFGDPAMERVKKYRHPPQK